MALHAYVGDARMFDEYRMQIPALIEHVESVCQFVSDIARSVGIDDDGVYRCYLAVEEICTNVIEHGYGYRGQDQVIDVVCRTFADRVEITIIDDAVAFNPLTLPDPDPGAPLSERKSGGWGFFFVKKYMDGVSYRYHHNRNYLTIQKYV
jgi:anti-sigma regulatory factor (Ser/Thr protein kinase)